MKRVPVLFILALHASGQSSPLCPETTTGLESFRLLNWATPEKHQIETMAGGVAVIDFDGDGLPDIFFTNGAPQPSLKKTAASANRLFRNKGRLQFEDVTAKAGLGGEGYSIGAAVADYDNDGHADIFVAGVKGNKLYRNRGNGTFEDVTVKAHIPATEWSVAAGWFDYDRDGKLDLLIINYVKWDPAKEPFCGDKKAGYRSYCHPKFYEGLPNTLLHNNGDGTFTDVSHQSGIAKHIGKGMGVAFADVDGDGWMDAFVTNDTTPNFLFRNKGDGTFEEIGLKAGVAMNDDGRALSSMGVDFRDIDNDGKPDAFVTALINETYPLYKNLGNGLFLDVTYPSKIGTATLPWSGWSTGIFDFDNDGRKDIFVANGDVQDNTEVYSSRKSRQANAVLLNQAAGFVAVQTGTAAMHRGAAFADFERNGKIGVIATRLNETPVLYRNCANSGNHWLGLNLRGTVSNRDAIGAQIEIETVSGRQWNEVTTSVGYASSSSRMVHFGLGLDKEVRRITITWPSGIKQELTAQPLDRYLEVVEPSRR